MFIIIYTRGMTIYPDRKLISHRKYTLIQVLSIMIGNLNYGNAYLERFKKISPHTQMMSVRRKKWPTSERS